MKLIALGLCRVRAWPRRVTLAAALFVAGAVSVNWASPEEFARPEPVDIEGYRGDAMEPFLTRDDRVLLFNDSNAPGLNTDIHWAERVSAA